MSSSKNPIIDPWWTTLYALAYGHYFRNEFTVWEEAIKPINCSIVQTTDTQIIGKTDTVHL